jgi:hypothetical protein
VLKTRNVRKVRDAINTAPENARRATNANIY